MRAPVSDAISKVIAHTGKSQEKVRNESFKAVLFVARLNPRSCPNEILLTPTHKRRLQPGEPG